MQIIVVDDEPLALESFIRSVRKITPISEIQGFQYPSDVLGYAREHSVDIAFLDIGLPEMNGLMLAERLKELHPCVNIILISGVKDYAMDALRLRVSGYLLKPCRLEEIADEITNLRYAPVE